MRAAARAMLAILALLGRSAHAQTLDRVRHDHTVRCAAVLRPGFATPVGGLANDLCQAIAEAIGGPDASGEVQAHDPDQAPSDAAFDLAFLSGEEIAQGNLSAAIIPGPPVFFAQIAALVPDPSAVQRPADLAGAVVCFMTASRAQQAVETALGSLRPPIARLAFREDVEMLDAFNAGRCGAMVDEAATLAALRRASTINERPSRLLTEPLDIFPIFAVTPRLDGAWAADVAWALSAVLPSRAELPWRGAWRAAADGLRPDWRAPDYAALYDRRFGPLALPPGPNRPWPLGLLTPVAR